MPIGAVKSWATAESRISIKAIEKDAGGWPPSPPPHAPFFVILLFTVQLGPGRGENALRTYAHTCGGRSTTSKTGVILTHARARARAR